MKYTRRDFARRLTLTAASGLIGIPLTSIGMSYIVKKGDTLGRIARRHKITTAELRQANHLSGDLIQVGQRLHIPKNLASGTSYTSKFKFHIVQRGDTLSEIAQTNGIAVAELKTANNLSSDLIRVGQTLQIPIHKKAIDYLHEVRTRNSQIKVQTNNWKSIIVHHSAIKYGNASVYDGTHRKRGMQNGLAYHFVIGNGIDSGDGEIEIGPRWTHQLLGGHVKNYNINLTAIGICLIGNFQETSPTQPQLEAFTQLMDWLRGEVVPRATRFAGHRDLKGEQTVCPGKNFPLEAMRKRYS